MVPLLEDLSSGVTCPVLATPRHGSWGADVCRAGARGGVRLGQHLVKSHPSASTKGDKEDGCGLFLGLVCFQVGGISPSARSHGTVSGTGCLVLQPFVAGRNMVGCKFIGS
jgi:hypothetical protein